MKDSRLKLRMPDIREQRGRRGKRGTAASALPACTGRPPPPPWGDMAGAMAPRMAKEMKDLLASPPAGVAAWPADGSSLSRLDAQIEGPSGTVYEGGVFRLEVAIPERYPYEPPKGAPPPESPGAQRALGGAIGDCGRPRSPPGWQP